MSNIKFLLADSSKSENVYVLHTEFPRFLINVETEEVELFEEIDEEEDADIMDELGKLITESLEFFDDEMKILDSEEE